MTKAVLQYGPALTLSKISEFSEYQFISAVSKFKPYIKRLFEHSDSLRNNELAFGQKRASDFAKLARYGLALI